MGGIGLEPTTSCVSSRQQPPNKDLPDKDLQNQPQGQCTKRRTQQPQENPKPASNQAETLPPDLAEIVAVWPELPGHIKAAVQALVQIYLKEQKK
jgi:hypothetical protein